MRRKTKRFRKPWREVQWGGRFRSGRGAEPEVHAGEMTSTATTQEAGRRTLGKSRRIVTEKGKKNDQLLAGESQTQRERRGLTAKISEEVLLRTLGNYEQYPKLSIGLARKTKTKR